jgi:hypothetical protein
MNIRNGVSSSRANGSRELSRGLGRDMMDARRAAWEDQLKAERDVASARGEQYAQVIEVGPRWDISNRSRAFVACLASQGRPPTGTIPT